MNLRSFQTLTVAIDGAIGRLTLSRPDKLNALSIAMLDELIGAARWFDARPEAKVVIVSGSGRSFCAGFDLADFVDRSSDRPVREKADLGRQMATAVTEMQAITIAAVQGHCVGGGLVLAAACDLRVAADDARFSIPEADLGIPLAWGGVPRLVRELGPAITTELVLTCRPFDAAEAKALRFVNRVVSAARLAAAADELATTIAAKSPLTLHATKRAVRAAAEQLVSTVGAARDADLLVAAAEDPDSRAVAARYLSRRRG